ncbi:HigA family addiction module antitoxin [Dongia sp.]|uniref:HigA family addiction module antitoxin n=1 Tax=Dongia sp. TaxID=1977262 RepID=UPI0035AF0D27
MLVVKNPVHPGDVLKELYLEPAGLSTGQLAKRLGVPRTRIERLVRGETAMTPDTAIRLARAFRTSGQFWMNLQTNYDLYWTGRDLKVGGIKPIAA